MLRAPAIIPTLQPDYCHLCYSTVKDCGRHRNAKPRGGFSWRNASASYFSKNKSEGTLHSSPNVVEESPVVHSVHPSNESLL